MSTYMLNKIIIIIIITQLLKYFCVQPDDSNCNQQKHVAEFYI